MELSIIVYVPIWYRPPYKLPESYAYTGVILVNIVLKWVLCH